ncbi:hypothetical protein AVEN_139953-1, partial [Araneus ventricosus]
MTRVQACSKLTKASKSPWNELAASLPCKLIANYSKNRVRTQPGIELATYHLVVRRRNHSSSSTTRGEDRFRKHSSGDLHSRLKTRKILGVGETDNGDIHRSK